MFSNLGLVGISLALTPKIINKEKPEAFELRKLFFGSSEYANNKLLKENTMRENICRLYLSRGTNNQNTQRTHNSKIKIQINQLNNGQK